MTKDRVTVGVFDSGVGGLSVLREIRALLPQARLVYVADSAHVPYGEKPPAYIEGRSLLLATFLAEQGADAIVVACNTATAAALKSLRDNFSIPVVGMEPAVKPAMAASRSGVIGVLATTGTLASARFAALLDRYQGDNTVITEPCPGWVEAVERGELAGERSRVMVEKHVLPLVTQGADVLILGCTHYPFLRPLITRAAGDGVAVLDTGAAVARQLRLKLAEAAPPPKTRPVAVMAEAGADETFYTSGDAAHGEWVIGKLWQTDAVVQALPEAFS